MTPGSVTPVDDTACREGALVCVSCGARYGLDSCLWHCVCGGMLDLWMRPRLDRERIASRAPTLWRYREALPVCDDSAIVTLGEGMTPLLEIELGRSVWLKQDQLFPTGSYKDRGASVLVSHLRELGVSEVVEDSSGNAGAAIAAYCARAGIRCAIYAPEATLPAKLAQIAAYGAEVHRIQGTREDTARAAWEAAQQTYYASHVWNPFFLHGCKTFAYEVCEQLGWRAPDVVVLPVGNGTLLLGAAIGFGELRAAGMIDRAPRLVAVQAAACAPLAVAYARAESAPAAIERRPTLAEGIAIAAPARGALILAAVRASGGAFVTVEEDEIQTAWKRLGCAGMYVEPTAAATVAGVLKVAGSISTNEVVVSVLTGHGLKAAGKQT